jgi:hypothetical protein
MNVMLIGFFSKYMKLIVCRVIFFTDDLTEGYVPLPVKQGKELRYPFFSLPWGIEFFRMDCLQAGTDIQNVQGAVNLLPDRRSHFIQVDTDEFTFPPGLKRPFPDSIPEPWQKNINPAVPTGIKFHDLDRCKVKVVRLFQDLSSLKKI